MGIGTRRVGGGGVMAYSKLFLGSCVWHSAPTAGLERGGGGGGTEAEEKLEQPENFILRSSACWLLSTVSHCAAGFCVQPFVIQIQRSQHQARIDVNELACIEHRKRAGYKRMLNGLNIQTAAVLDFVFCDISFRSNGTRFSCSHSQFHDV